jgi:hypothetical protein
VVRRAVVGRGVMRRVPRGGVLSSLHRCHLLQM